MSYTFLNMQSKLSSLLGDDNTGTTDQFPLASRKKELNRGEMQFCREAMLVRAKSTGTVSSNQIALPSDCLQIHVLIVSNYVITRQREISIEDYERFYNYGGAIPVYYISEESGARYIKLLGSVTGAAYALYYFKKPDTELSDDSDTGILPEEYREGPVYYAASELLRQVGKNEISNTYYQRFLTIVRDAKAYAERLYMSKQYAVPDVNLVMGADDLIGGGYDYSLM